MTLGGLWETATVGAHATSRTAGLSHTDACRLAAVRSRIGGVLRTEVRQSDTGDLVAVYEHGMEVTSNGAANPPSTDVR